MGDRKINEKFNFMGTDNLYTQQTTLSALSDEHEKFSSLSTSAMLAKGEVPLSHTLVADNYMVIKKIYGTPVIKSPITLQEKALLAKYDFNTLEYSTIKQINEDRPVGSIYVTISLDHPNDLFIGEWQLKRIKPFHHHTNIYLYTYERIK